MLSVYSAESGGFATEKKNKSKLFTIQTFGTAAKRLQVEDLPELTNLPLGELGAIDHTPTGKSGDKSESQNLVSGLFSESDIDADLRTVIERWDGLSVELRRAIVRMVRYHKEGPYWKEDLRTVGAIYCSDILFSPQTQYTSLCRTRKVLLWKN